MSAGSSSNLATLNYCSEVSHPLADSDIAPIPRSNPSSLPGTNQTVTGAVTLVATFCYLPTSRRPALSFSSHLPFSKYGQLQQSGYTQSNNMFVPSKVTYHLADIAPILRSNPSLAETNHWQTGTAIPLPRHVFLPHAALPLIRLFFYLEHGQLQPEQSGYTQSNSVFVPS